MLQLFQFSHFQLHVTFFHNKNNNSNNNNNKNNIDDEEEEEENGVSVLKNDKSGRLDKFVVSLMSAS